MSRPATSHLSPRITAIFILLGLLLSGCAVVGPEAISNGRLSYNEAIARTNDQQMLMVVLKNRYGERGSLLAVSSVTANVRIISSLGIQAGFGDSDDYTGNLVPLSAGAVYEENPTISYSPVEGERYLNQLMSPVPVATVAQLATSLTDPEPILITMITSVNGIYNPQFQQRGESSDPRFKNIVTLMAELIRSRRLHWASDESDKGDFSIILDRADPSQQDNIDELLQLIGLPQPVPGQKRIVVPVSLALHGREAGAIGLTTRAVYELVEVMSAAVEVPEPHQREGVAVSFPPLGLVGQNLHVRSSEKRPDTASVVVKYRDYWFYIDDRDVETKLYFKLVGALWASTMAESAHAKAPMLTVPVSR